VRIATAGSRYVERFTWSATAARFGELASASRADPAPFLASGPIDLATVPTQAPS
jgi:hypothetical protein